MRVSWRMLVLTLASAVASCDEAEPRQEQVSDGTAPEERRLIPPAEGTIVHGPVDVTAAGVPTRFRGPFPDSIDGLEAGSWVYTPWSYAHARLCAGDAAVQGRILEALHRASSNGQLLGSLDGEVDNQYYSLVGWCRTATPCRWAAEVALEDEDAAVSSLAWQVVGSCPVRSVRSAIDAESSPDETVIQWYRMMGEGGGDVPDRLARTAAATIDTVAEARNVYALLPLAGLLVRYDDPRVAQWFDAMLDIADPDVDEELLVLLARRNDPWARARLRRPCRRGTLSPDQCLPPAHPYDPYLFEDEPAFSASVRRFERAPLLERLEACVYSKGSVDSFYRARCLSRLADLDWRRAAALSPHDDQDSEDSELGPVFAVLATHPEAPLQVRLRKHGLIGPSPDRDAADIEGIDAQSVLTRYGRAFTVGTGVYDDVYDQKWAIHDLSNLSSSLEGTAFEIQIDPTGLGEARRMTAYLDGHRYTHDFVQEGDTDGVRAMMVLLNGMLAHRDDPNRFAVTRMDDLGVSVALGEPKALRAAAEENLLHVYGPDAL